MMFGKVLLTAIFMVAVPAVSFAQNMGTPEEQAACRPDTRKFCTHLKADAGPFVFLACLQSNRAKLSKACLKVLESNGQ